MATGAVKSGFTSAVALFFEYDTPKIVHIKSKKVGFINRLIQLAILGYIIGYAIVYEKGYQEKDQVVSATSSKVKGVSFTNLSGTENPGQGARIWDVADYVIPPQENDAFFVMTNAVVSYNQTQSTCGEDLTKPNVVCASEADCPRGVAVANGNGVRTGNCVPSPVNSTVKVCEVFAWCPVEKDNDFPIPGKPLINNAAEFTVLLKNQIEFPKFNIRRRNILETQNASYLESCRYDSSHDLDKFCPIFELGYIVKEAKEDINNLSLSGGFILVKIEWECNLDRSIDNCVPNYSFRRLDDPQSRIAKGWNFRYANYYYEEGVEYRDLIKAYGIRFIVKVTGEAGKFSFVPLLLNLGSGLGLLAIATVLCDIVTMYFLKKGTYYKEKKYLFVEDADDMQTDYLDEDNTLYQLIRQEAREKLANSQSAGPSSYQAFDDNHAPPVTVQQTPPEENSVKNRRPGSYGRLEEEED